ncbi:hypothetical protein ACVWWI_006646 [Bradyrhizobium sp. USDA 3686]|nr:hypothetical protein [Bradyrhizobium canariense]
MKRGFTRPLWSKEHRLVASGLEALNRKSHTLYG